jgi:hypothetical protein
MQLSGLPSTVRHGALESWCVPGALAPEKLQPVSIHIVINPEDGSFSGRAYLQMFDESMANLHLQKRQPIDGFPVRVERSSTDELLRDVFRYSYYAFETGQKRDMPKEL